MHEEFATTRADDAWFELNALGGSAHRLRLGGAFRPAWVAALCSGLAERQISIQQAHAKRQPSGAWIAELRMTALPGSVDPRGIAFPELARADVRTPETSLQLDVCRVIESRAHGGSLRIELEAADSLGLLGTLLSSLARLTLFPVEMHIETRLGRAEDTLWLASIGGRSPTRDAALALERLCTSWTRRT